MSCLLYDLVFWRTIPSNVEGLMRVKAANCFRSRKIFWGLILGRLIWFCLKSSLPPRWIPRELLEFDESITPKNKLYQTPLCVIAIAADTTDKTSNYLLASRWFDLLSVVSAAVAKTQSGLRLSLFLGVVVVVLWWGLILSLGPLL